MASTAAILKKSWIYDSEFLINIYYNTFTTGNHSILVNFKEATLIVDNNSKPSVDQIKFIVKDDIVAIVFIRRTMFGGRRNDDYQCMIINENMYLPSVTFGGKMGYNNNSNIPSYYQVDIVSSTTTRLPEVTPLLAKPSVMEGDETYRHNRITGANVNVSLGSSECTFYAIKIREYSTDILKEEGKERVIHRRFREFKELESVILQHYGAIINTCTSNTGVQFLPLLPRHNKLLTNHSDAEFIRTRTMLLQSFLHAVNSLPLIHKLPAFTEFCGLNADGSSECSFVLKESTRHSVFSICPTAIRGSDSIKYPSHLSRNEDPQLIYSSQVEKVVSPSQYPDIQSGDVIVRVSGTSTLGLGFSDVISLLRVAGRPLIVQFQRASAKDSSLGMCTDNITVESKAIVLEDEKVRRHERPVETRKFSLKVPVQKQSIVASPITPLSVATFKQTLARIAENTSIVSASASPQSEVPVRSRSLRGEDIYIMTPRSAASGGPVMRDLSGVVDTKSAETSLTCRPSFSRALVREPSMRRFSLDLQAVAAVIESQEENEEDDDEDWKNDYDASCPTDTSSSIHERMMTYRNMYSSTRELSYRSRGDVLRRQYSAVNSVS